VDSAAAPAGRHRSPYKLTWPRFAERLLGGWGPSLRMATLLVIILAAGIACILAVWGAFGVACVLLLCAILQLVVSHVNRPLRI
jgi:fatty acid desaturase